MRNPKNLSFWSDLTQLIVRVYRFCAHLPTEEKYNLVSQVKRAAVSIRLNIVEGAACESPTEFARFLEIAYRSAKETQTGVELSAELGLCQPELVQDLLLFIDRVAGAIYSYRQSVLS